MFPRPRLALLHLAKWLGLFGLAHRLTRGQLRILCYHGASLDDEHRFRPSLFMSPEVFRSRMEWLARKRFEVLALDEALARWRGGALPARPVVITLDDGWVGSARHMLPALRAHGFPFTLYVPSAYAVSDEPVPGVMVDYLLWKSPLHALDLAAVTPELAGVFDLREPARRDEAKQRLLHHLGALPDHAGRMHFFAALARTLGLDPDALRSRRMCQVLSPAELAALAGPDLDLQLHTHDHVMPGTDAGLRAQLETNREHLAALRATPANHLCYPSGEYSPAHFATLRALGILSATTCEPGFVTGASHPFALPRFLDRDDFSPIEFEAELSGFKQVLRALRTFARALGRASSRPVPGSTTPAR